MLGKNRDLITRDYTAAIELSHRINHDNILIKNVTVLNSQTSSLLNQIENIMTVAKAFNDGFNDVIRLVTNDMKQYNAIVEDYMIAYDTVYKAMRHRAANYVFQAVRQVQDLSYELETAPTSFDSFYDAQWFYTSLSPLLDRCVVSIRLASSYLIKVKYDEANNQPIHSPDRFYLHESGATLCYTQYSIISQVFDKTISVLSYASQKVSQWLQGHSRNITYSTAYKFSNFGTENFLHDNLNISDTSDLWTLLKCTECDFNSDPLNYSIWRSLVNDLTWSMSSNIITCLMEYEEALLAAHNSSVQLSPSPPSWYFSDTMSNYVAALKFNELTLDKLLHDYMIGTKTLQEVTSSIANTALIMSKNVQSIEDEIVSSAVTWRNDVIKWRNGLIELFILIADDILNLSQFIIDSTSLEAFGRSLSVWHIQRVFLDVVSYQKDEAIVNYPSLIPVFNANLTSFLQYNARSVINETLFSIIENNLHYSQQQCKAITSSNELWAQFADQVKQTTTLYETFFVLDDDFVR